MGYKVGCGAALIQRGQPRSAGEALGTVSLEAQEVFTYVVPQAEAYREF